MSGNVGGSGGGGAGAGIGGNGGAGGLGAGYWLAGNGGNGEDCGIINIDENVIIWAYGGRGGSGGLDDGSNWEQSGSGSGAGGYPAAGIGGGGAGGGGGTHAYGGGGYSGGVREKQTGNPKIINGGIDVEYVGGGSYFSNCKIVDDASKSDKTRNSFGRAPGQGEYAHGPLSPYSYSTRVVDGSRCGDGGVAGKGGTVKVSKTCTINAFNGCKYTDITINEDQTETYVSGHEETKINPTNQCSIYAQKGIVCDTYIFYSNGYDERKNVLETILGVTIDASSYCSETSYLNYCIPGSSRASFAKPVLLGYENPITGDEQGIGSGAGYIELSNGIYEEVE